MSRKRARTSDSILADATHLKRLCPALDDSTMTNGLEPISDEPLDHPVLSLYFPTLQTLRKHLAGALAIAESRRALKRLNAVDSALDLDLCSLLDSAIVGVSEIKENPCDIESDIAGATQCTSSGGCQPEISQPEVVDLVQQILFRRSCHAPKGSKIAVYPGKPNHILALGYSIHSGGRPSLSGCHVGPFGLQVVNTYPNSHVNALKSQVWGRLLRLIGDKLMFKLLLEASIFMPLGKPDEQNKKAYYQLSGPPISDALNNPSITPFHHGISRSNVPDMKHQLSDTDTLTKKGNERRISQALSGNYFAGAGVMKNPISQEKSLGDIIFVRSRIFYSKPVYNARGKVLFGLPHIHVFNRFPNTTEHARHILKYIFPRQYGLHNVFISEVDRKETVQPFQDYTLREHEIDVLKRKHQGKEPAVPRRLRGKVLALIVKMQKLHKSCSYHALVKYYCPASLCDPGVPDTQLRPHVSGSSSFITGGNTQLRVKANAALPSVESTLIRTAATPQDQTQKDKFTEFSSPSGEVSGFVRAVISRVIPNDFFGDGENKKTVMRAVDRFVKLRRFESLSLHEVTQRLKLTSLDWLCLSSMRPAERMSKSDETKRQQLFAEFMYWLFDSFVIPLLRSHFYITESGVDRNRIFYFRHDVWKKLSEPTLTRIKGTMLEELTRDNAQRLLKHRKLGFVQIRLLPKENGARPIMNLRKRGMSMRNGKTRLTPSINTIMTPVFNALSFEKSRNPDRMGSSMFSIGDMYHRIKAFRAHLNEKCFQNRKLYFAKVDVQACFDTIPQSSLLRLVRIIMAEEEYRIDRYVEVCPPPSHQVPNKFGVKRPVKKFIAQAKPGDEIQDFGEFAETMVERLKPATILVDDVVGKAWDRDALMDLLEKHIQENIIKVGKKYFRQKKGIPQGSILSSILCNFFYAELEREKLSFISEDCLLLRLIDDFLYITPDKDKAEKFLQTMHDGNPEYGAFVNPEKSLVNFETTINSKKVQQLVGTMEFPYCGNVVHTKTLNIRRDREKKNLTNVDSTITVEYSRRPGNALIRKVVSSFKIQTHPMYFNTAFNGLETAIKNIYHAFVELAMKFHRYVKSLQRSKRLEQRQFIASVSEVLELAWVMLKSKQTDSNGSRITHRHVKWLGAHAFRKVLERKQSGYKKLLEWLRETEKIEGRRPAGLSGLGLGPFKDFRY